MPAADAREARAADRVQLVEKNYGRGAFLGLLKEIAHAARAHADEHLYEFGAGCREERNSGLARHRSRQQGLAGPGRAVKQDALGQFSAQCLVLLGILQVIDNIPQLVLGLFAAGHVLESDFLLLKVLLLGLRLAEGHRLLAAHLGLADKKEPPDKDKDQYPADIQDEGGYPAPVGLGSEIRYPGGFHILYKFRVRHRNSLKLVALFHFALYQVLAHAYLHHLLVPQLGLELRIGDLALFLHALDILVNRDKKHEGQKPKKQLS